MGQNEITTIQSNLQETLEDIAAIEENPSYGHDVELETILTRRKDSAGNYIKKVVQSIDNMVIVMRQDPDLNNAIRFNEMTRQPWRFGELPWHSQHDNYGEWTDYDDANLKSFLERKYDLQGREKYENAFRIVSTENGFHPIKQFLNALVWDNTPRIEHLLTWYLGADDNEYTRAVMKVHFMAGIKRIYSPGCKYDYVPILTGPQGCGKSRFCRLMSLRDDWFLDNLRTIEGRESIEAITGKWVIEIAELLAVKRQKDVEGIKSFITQQSDKCRWPFDRRPTELKRSCIFIGTTNDRSFLTDRTGNRRFLPVECFPYKRVKDPFGKEAAHDFEQAWAEALYYFNRADGEVDLTLPKDIQDGVVRIQRQFLEDDPRIGIIQEYLDTSLRDQTCVMELWEKALKENGHPTRRDSNQINTIMRNEIKGWEEAGQQRFSEYGQQRAYQKIKQNKENIPDGFIPSNDDDF